VKTIGFTVFCDNAPLVADGAVADGAVADGAVADGAVADGAVADGAVADGGEHSFDRVGRAQVVPVFGREVEEGQHGLGIFG
jgi:hypothetical protein